MRKRTKAALILGGLTLGAITVTVLCALSNGAKLEEEEKRAYAEYLSTIPEKNREMLIRYEMDKRKETESNQYVTTIIVLGLIAPILTAAFGLRSSTGANEEILSRIRRNDYRNGNG